MPPDEPSRGPSYEPACKEKGSSEASDEPSCKEKGSSEGSHEASHDPFLSHEGSHEASEEASGQGSRGLGPFLNVPSDWPTRLYSTACPMSKIVT